MPLSAAGTSTASISFWFAEICHAYEPIRICLRHLMTRAGRLGAGTERRCRTKTSALVCCATAKAFSLGAGHLRIAVHSAKPEKQLPPENRAATAAHSWTAQEDNYAACRGPIEARRHPLTRLHCGSTVSRRRRRRNHRVQSAHRRRRRPRREGRRGTPRHPHHRPRRTRDIGNRGARKPSSRAHGASNGDRHVGAIRRAIDALATPHGKRGNSSSAHEPGPRQRDRSAT